MSLKLGVAPVAAAAILAACGAWPAMSLRTPSWLETADAVAIVCLLIIRFASKQASVPCGTASNAFKRRRGFVRARQRRVIISGPHVVTREAASSGVHLVRDSIKVKE